MGDAAEQYEAAPDVIETEGVEVPVDSTETANDTEVKQAEVIDMNEYRENKEAEEAQKELERLQAELDAAVNVANQIISTGEEVLKVTEGNSYMSKAFDKSVAVFDDYVVQKAIAPLWDKLVPDDAKKAMTYVPSTTPDVFAGIGNSLAQAGFIEVPDVDASEVVNNQQKLFTLAAKYGQYVDPKLKVVGYLDNMAKYIGKKKDALFYAKVRAAVAKNRAANDNNAQPAAQPATPQTDIPEAFQNPTAANDSEAATG